jgi:AcrR family transcriptional regulator
MAPKARTPPDSWIDAGLRALAGGGPDAVRVDALARGLGVTRGSFYWHFANRQALLDAMLDTWERRSTDDVLKRVEQEAGDTLEKVRLAGLLTFAADLMPIDLAVRDWARRDASVGKRLRRVDNRRMEYLRLLMSRVIDDQDDIEASSMLAFSLGIGVHFIAADHGGRSRAEVIDGALKRIVG